MSKREYAIDLRKYHKLSVGEGESDRNFLAAFCAANGIDGFDYGFSGMHNEGFNPSGFDVFESFLATLPRLAGFASLTDLVLLCDSTDNPANRLGELRRQIREANRMIGNQLFAEMPNANEVAAMGTPRLHVLMIPKDAQGGLESVCFEVARDYLNDGGQNDGTRVEGWVNDFADCACKDWGTQNPWTIEKRDKLR